MINIGEWIDGDSKRFAAAILKMILLYTLGILESIGCMSRQLGIHIAGFLIIRKVSGQGILYCRIILEKLSGVLKVKQIPKFKTRIRERNMNALCISHFLCFGEQFVFGRDRIRGIIVHITVCNDPYSIAIGYRKLIFALVFHSFPNQSEVIGFAPFGVAADHANINVGLAAAIMFKILRLSLRTLRHNQNDRFYFSASLSTLFNLSTRAILQPSLDKRNCTKTADQISLFYFGVLANGKIIKGEQVCGCGLLIFSVNQI